LVRGAGLEEAEAEAEAPVLALVGVTTGVCRLWGMVVVGVEVG
jgi:hypothetical protein